MTTVVLTPAQVFALGEILFIAITFHVVQQDRTSAVAKMGHHLDFDGRATAELPTYHVGIIHIPAIVTHSPPDTFVIDLDTTLAAMVSIHQTGGLFACRNKQVCTSLQSLGYGSLC